MRVSSLLWNLLVWTLVPDSSDALMLDIPEQIQVVVKRYDANEVIVDHVFAPIYRTLNVTMRQLVEAQCGQFEFRMVIDYCGCPATTNATSKSRVLVDYSMTFYLHSGLAYFSSMITGAHAVVDEVGDVAALASSMPLRLQVNRDEELRHYGPVAVTQMPTRRKRIPILPERAFREWAQQEISRDNDKLYFWDRTVSRSAAGSPGPASGRDDRVRVMFGEGPAVTLARNECYKLETDGLPFANLTLDGGGCVRAYEGKRCAGWASRMVVQQPTRLYFGVRDDQPAKLSNVKSVSGCCVHELNLWPRDGRWSATSDRDVRHAVCSCGVGGGVAAFQDDKPPLPRKKLMDYKEARELNEDQLTLLRDLRKIANSQVEAAKEAAVSVATEDTPEKQMMLASLVAKVVSFVVNAGNQTLGILDGARLPWPVALSFLDNSVKAVDKAARRAAAASLGDASAFSMDAALMATCVPPMMALAHGDPTNESEESDEEGWYPGIENGELDDNEVTRNRREDQDDGEKEEKDWNEEKDSEEEKAHLEYQRRLDHGETNGVLLTLRATTFHNFSWETLCAYSVVDNAWKCEGRQNLKLYTYCFSKSLLMISKSWWTRFFCINSILKVANNGTMDRTP